MWQSRFYAVVAGHTEWRRCNAKRFARDYRTRSAVTTSVVRVEPTVIRVEYDGSHAHSLGTLRRKLLLEQLPSIPEDLTGHSMSTRWLRSRAGSSTALESQSGGRVRIPYPLVHRVFSLLHPSIEYRALTALIGHHW